MYSIKIDVRTIKTFYITLKKGSKYHYITTRATGYLIKQHKNIKPVSFV